MKFDDVIHYFRNKKYAQMKDGLLDASNDEKMLRKLTVLQNEISVAYDTKVIGITSVKEDELTAYFGKAFVEAYRSNGASCLLIDANLFEPQLGKLLGLEKKGEEKIDIQNLCEGIDVALMDKEVYPSSVYKSGVIQELINANKEKYDHFVILFPSVTEHKEISLFKGTLNSTLLLSRQNVTKKGQIYEALCFLKQEEVPVSKTIVLK